MNTDKVFFKKTSEDMISQILEKTKVSLINTNEDCFINGMLYILDEEESMSLTPYTNLMSLTKTEQAFLRYNKCVVRRHNCWVHNNQDHTNENMNLETGEEKKRPGKLFITDWL